VKPETAQTAKTMVGIAAGIASVAIPGAAIPIQIGRAAAIGIIEAYDALMQARPAEVTVEEWRAILAGPVHSPNFVDGLVNEARTNRSTNS
jgi:hypothetical protein